MSSQEMRKRHNSLKNFLESDKSNQSTWFQTKKICPTRVFDIRESISSYAVISLSKKGPWGPFESHEHRYSCHSPFHPCHSVGGNNPETFHGESRRLLLGTAHLRETFVASFSAVSTPIFAIKYSLESWWRDLSAIRLTFFCTSLAENVNNLLTHIDKHLCGFLIFQHGIAFLNFRRIFSGLQQHRRSVKDFQ